MNDNSELFERLTTNADIIRSLPPLPYFRVEDEERAIDVVKWSIPIGDHLIMLDELLIRTVNGGSGPSGRVETFRTSEIIDRLLEVGAFDLEDQFSLLTVIACEDFELPECNRTWWLLHKDDVLAPFTRRGVVASALPDAMLVSNISAEIWEHLEALVAYGLPWNRVLKAIADHEILIHQSITPKWRSGPFRA